MQNFKDILKYLALIILAGLFVWGISAISKGCSSERETVQAIARGDVKTNYEERVRVDTVVKFLEKIVYKEVPAKTIYTQFVDTVFMEDAKKKDLILDVKKEGDELTINTVDINGNIIKEYSYDGVGNDFTATAQQGNLFIKSKKIEWGGLHLNTGYEVKDHSTPVSKFNVNNIYVGASTSITILNNFKLSLSTKYHPTLKELPSLNLEAGIRIK